MQLGHRTSIDFDLFKIWNQWSWKEIFKRIEKTWFKLDKKSDLNYLSDEQDPDCNLYFNWVKIQLINFGRNPFGKRIKLSPSKTICKWLKTLNLLELWALKIFAMMYRSKWKDAVDLCFIINNWHSLTNILNKTHKIFWDLFQEKAAFETIIEKAWDKTEKVDYIISNPPKDEEIENDLIDIIKEQLII